MGNSQHAFANAAERVPTPSLRNRERASTGAGRLQRSGLCIAIGAALAAIAPLAAAQANVVTGGDIPGSFKLPGSDTSVRIGGYVKLDAIFNSRSAGAGAGGDQLLVPGTIPVGPNAGNNESNQLTIHARQSRLNVTTSKPTGYGPLTTFIEADFFSTAPSLSGNEVVSNSHGLRLRHAYGTLGKFSAGQFWTNFLNTRALTDTLDFGGPAAQIFVRQPQVRWTEKFRGGEWAISAESPESVLAVSASGTTVIPDDDRYPDVVGHVSFGNLWFAAMARNIRIDSAAAPAAVENKWGGALYVSGRIPAGQDDFRFAAYGGNAIGRYSAGFNVDGVIDASGGLSLPDVVGGYASYRHFWRSDLRSSLVLSASSASNPSGTPGTINKSNNSAHLNLIWSPAKPVDLGVEYIYAKRTIENGDSGTLSRVQFSAIYPF